METPKRRTESTAAASIGAAAFSFVEKLKSFLLLFEKNSEKFRKPEAKVFCFFFAKRKVRHIMNASDPLRQLIGGGLIFYCPGCKDAHCVNSSHAGPRWTFNGSFEKPTFSPSILVTCRWGESDSDMKDEICHSFVRDGQIQFLTDCTHELAGQSVPLPPWPHAPGTYGGINE